MGHHFGYIDQKNAGFFEIVGVTEDTQYRDATHKIPPMFFLPSTQSVVFDNPRFKAFEARSHDLNSVELKTLGKVPELEAQVRHAFADVNPDLAVIDFTSFADQVGLELLSAEDDCKTYFVVRIARAGACVGGSVRRHRIFGGAALERNWSSHGAGRGPVEHFETGATWSVGADGNRVGDRHSGHDSRRSRDGYATIWDQAVRSTHSADGERGADFRGAPGCGGAGSARGDAGPHSRLAHGIMVGISSGAFRRQP